MEINIRQMKIKNHPDYLFNDNMIRNVKDFDSSLLKIYKLSFKGVFSLNIYCIKHIPTKTLDHVDDDKDYLYLFIDDVHGCIEENDGIKYSVFTPTVKKQVLKNYQKLWKQTKRQIEVINDDEPIKYRKEFMKIRFESDDNFPLGKTFSISDMIIVVAYPHIFLHECTYKL